MHILSAPMTSRPAASDPTPCPAAARPAPVAVAAQPPIEIRPLGAVDSIAELTRLLHRAYRPQVEMGLRPLAGRQDEATTLARTSSGENYLALAREPIAAPNGARLDAGRILGTILFQEVESAAFPEHFLKPGVSHFSLFAVDPDCQGMGVGAALLNHVERRAASLRFDELALSMAEPDAALHAFYLRRGYRFVQHWQWPYTNYRSLILSKRVPRNEC